jgi:DNA-directed RNA polymerase specialized sigma24 family protein
MSDHHDEDYSLLNDIELLARIGWLWEILKDEAEARKALAEFRQRYDDYTTRICGAILEHIISPVRVNDLLTDIFLNVMLKASTFRQPEQVLEAAKIRQHIHKWLNGIICHTLLERAKDNELLTQIAIKDASEQATYIAFQAHQELTRRHGHSLLRYCKRQPNWNLDSEVAQDIVSETFLKVLMRAKTYDDHGLTDREKLSALTYRWIESIAHNVYIDLERERCKQPLIYFDRVEALEALLWQCRAWQDFGDNIDARMDGGEEEETLEKKNLHLECLDKALRRVKLTERERHILEAKLQKDFTEEERSEALKAIEETHGIKSDNRRKIYSRLCKKLGDCMAAQCDECRQRILKKRQRDQQEKLNRQWRKKAAPA